MGEGPSRAENDQVESILLAEYSALRTEVERRCNIQWSLFALQVTTAGAIASLAISPRQTSRWRYARACYAT